MQNISLVFKICFFFCSVVSSVVSMVICSIGMISRSSSNLQDVESMKCWICLQLLSLIRKWFLLLFILMLSFVSVFPMYCFLWYMFLWYIYIIVSNCIKLFLCSLSYMCEQCTSFQRDSTKVLAIGVPSVHIAMYTNSIHSSIELGYYIQLGSSGEFYPCYFLSGKPSDLPRCLSVINKLPYNCPPL